MDQTIQFRVEEVGVKRGQNGIYLTENTYSGLELLTLQATLEHISDTHSKLVRVTVVIYV